MNYKHAYLNTLLLLHSKFMLSVVKMSLKEEVGGHALNSHGNYIADQGIVFLNFCENLVLSSWVKIFRIIPEFRTLRLTIQRKSASISCFSDLF